MVEKIAPLSKRYTNSLVMNHSQFKSEAELKKYMTDTDTKLYLILEIDEVDKTLNQDNIRLYKNFYNACDYLLERHCYKVEDLSPKDLRHKYVFVTPYKRFIMLVFNLDRMKL